ncbi:WD repeat-containing protein 5 homolog [Sycon ciliatum]|uniref:WD repeat-containing protein 5 homolog n=1 Tax=Sycon ciliatum TaxID=27933 RepID=UPI0031F709A3
MATASQDCQVRIYDMESGSRKCSVLGDVFDEDPGVVDPRTDVCMYGSHSSHVYAVKFNPIDDNLLISGGWDRGVRLWDLRTKSHVKTLGACGPIVTGDSLDYKKAGDVILVGSHSRDNCLEEYDVGTGKVISSIKLSVPSQICCCQYMGEDQNVVLCGGKQDNMMRVLSTTGDGGTLARVSNLERSVYSVAHCKPRDHKVTVKRKGGELVTRTERFGFIAMCTDTLVCIYRHEIE